MSCSAREGLITFLGVIQQWPRKVCTSLQSGESLTVHCIICINTMYSTNYNNLVQVNKKKKNLIQTAFMCRHLTGLYGSFLFAYWMIGGGLNIQIIKRYVLEKKKKNSNDSGILFYSFISPSPLMPELTNLNPCPAEPGYTLPLQTV